jgi:D-apionolactonase
VTASSISAAKNKADSRVFLDGRAEAAPPPLALRAGPLSLLFEDGGLRYIRLGDREIVRRIYAAVRDENWGTVPQTISNLQTDVRPDSFRIEFDVHHVQGAIDYAWHGTITGEPSGRIDFAFDGVANSTFRKNRIGFCILHPLELAGIDVEIRHPDGARETSQFPRYIAPYNPFLDVIGMRHAAAAQTQVTLQFDGDIFETEDQRNWIDASFKTFCTPLSQPFPVEIQAGERVSQRITLELQGTAEIRAPLSVSTSETVELSIDKLPIGPLPKIGFVLPTEAPPLTAGQIDRLRLLKPAHLRCELRLGGDFRQVLQQAANTAAQLDAALDLVLFIGPETDRELSTLLEEVRQLQPRIARWSVYPAGDWSTTAGLASAARPILKAFDPRIPIGGGTAANFLELNRARPQIDLLDFVTWSMQPQEHAFDNASLVETLAAHTAVVESARQFAGGLPLVVGPITLTKRINPYATGAWPPPSSPHELPPTVDIRQMTLFGAAWTLGSLKYLAESGVSAATYCELIGWKGLIESDVGSPVPDRFPSVPGGVFPLFHVFADLAELPAAEVLPSRSSDPLRVDSLTVRSGQRMHVFVANFTEQPQELTITLAAKQAWLRLLDENTALHALESPELFRASRRLLAPGAHGLTLVLPRCAMARVEVEE